MNLEKKDYLYHQVTNDIKEISLSMGRQNLKYFLGFLASLNSKNTIRAYRIDLVQFFKFLNENCKNTSLFDAKRIHIELFGKYLKTYRNERKKPLSNSSIKRKLTAISKFYTYLVRSSLLKESPALYIERPSVPLTVKSRPITRENFKKMLEATSEENLMELTHKVVLYLLFSTGIRVGELRNLKIGDIQYEGELRKLIVIAKGEKRLEKNLSSEVSKLINRYLRMVSDQNYPMGKDYPLIRVTRGKERYTNPISSQMVKKIIDRFCKFSGIEESFSPHSTRVTFITEALEKFDLGTVADTVGHSSTIMTNEYDKRRKNVSREISEFII